VSSAVQREFGRQPALDGVRAIAVALVLLFHQGWMSGGYVGVSVFFTLSGYLITSLALHEHERTGHLDVRAFYGRRVRRLLPASFAVLLAVVALALTGVFDDVAHLRRDLWGAVGQVYNWVALAGGESYTEMVGGADAGRSPVDHFWSLAIEEQFYWVWPLVLVVVLRRPLRRRVAAIAGITVAFAAAAPLIAARWGGDAAYWATPARLAEILAGALLGVLLHARRGRPLPPVVGLLGPLGLVAILGAAITWPSSAGPAHDGWLPVFALASVALILGLQAPTRLRVVLSSRPLVVLGAISYGVYLFHWPVYVVLDPERTHLPTVPLFALRLVVTLALAVVSFRHLENPVRRARPRRWLVPLGAATAGAAVALAVVLVPSASRPYWMTAEAADVPPAAVPDTSPLRSTAPTTAAEPAATDQPDDPVEPAVPVERGERARTTQPADTAAPEATAPAASVLAATATAPVPTEAAATPAVPARPVVPPLPATAPSRPVRVLVVGDSTAVAAAKGLEAFDDQHPDLVDVVSMALPGCGMIPDGAPAFDTDGTFARMCSARRAEVSADLSWLRPDAVLGLVTLADIDQRTWDPAEGALGPADPRFFDRLVAAYDAATLELLAAGAGDVLWAVPPVPAVGYREPQRYLLDPQRYARYAEALQTVADRHPGQVAVLDVAGWIAAQPGPFERPDGLHWSPDASARLAAELLGPTLVAAALT
jgi:peptidoglycan/LPS O-acetylase OafA/YrhL